VGTVAEGRGAGKGFIQEEKRRETEKRGRVVVGNGIFAVV